MFTHILLASDGSECATKATHVAATLAAKFSSRLTIVNVYLPTPAVGPFGETFNVGMEDDLAETTQEAVLHGAGRIADGHDVPYRCRKQIGSPDTEIVRVAGEDGCDLIVLGSRGLDAVASFFLGSVSDHVTHHAHCPVLIVR